MSVYYSDDRVTLHAGDCLGVLATLPENSIDAICTDPPYGLEFMGKDWDKFGTNTGNGYREKPRMTDDHMGKGFKQLPNHFEAGRPFQQWCQLWATECLRVLKPGGHMLTFGGTRTFHRLACAIEDAGFEIRDSIAWLYGSGFPKSLDVSKAIDRAAGAQRDVIAAGAPVKRMIPGADQNKTGSWLKDNGREFVPTETAPATDAAKQWSGWGTALKPAFEPIVVARKPLAGTVAGNVQAYGTGALNIDGCRVEAQARPLRVGDYKQTDNAVWEGRMDGSLQGGSKAVGTTDQGRWPSNVVLDGGMADELDKQTPSMTITGHRTERSKAARVQGTGWLSDNHLSREYPDDPGGGASRFFPTFKYTPKAATTERPTADGIAHPTVKPLELMRWLIRLVTPPHGTVLDPFAGSGTTGEAAIHEHMHAVLIEREPTYLPLIVARLSKPMAVGFDFEEEPA